MVLGWRPPRAMPCSRPGAPCLRLQTSLSPGAYRFFNGPLPSLLSASAESIRGANPVEMSPPGRNPGPVGCSKERAWDILWREYVGFIREDYYSTSIAACDSWSLNPWNADGSAETCRLNTRLAMDEILISRKSTVEIRSQQRPAQDMWPYDTTGSRDPTAICRSKSLLAATGDRNGDINVYDVNMRSLLAHSTLDALTAEFDAPAARRPPGRLSYASCMVWLNRARPTCDDVLVHFGIASEFVVGDDRGRIFVVALTNATELRVVNTVANPGYGNSDTICSMALSPDASTLCVSDFDCTITVWKLAYGQKLSCVGRIPHSCVIRGLAISPGLENVLATGGGRNDRCLRIIALTHGAVLHKVEMPAQIVGVVWVSKCEVFVALGHSRVNGYVGLGQVYNVLTDQIVAELPGRGYALTAVKTMQGFCINTSRHELIHYVWHGDRRAGSHRQCILHNYSLKEATSVFR